MREYLCSSSTDGLWRTDDAGALSLAGGRGDSDGVKRGFLTLRSLSVTRSSLCGVGVGTVVGGGVVVVVERQGTHN